MNTPVDTDKLAYFALFCLIIFAAIIVKLVIDAIDFAGDDSHDSTFFLAVVMLFGYIFVIMFIFLTILKVLGWDV